MKVLVSGGFDPLHIGHIRLIEAAAAYGEVVVALNSDAWLVRKKGYRFMPWHERAEILRALKAVKEVIAVDDSDGHVAAAIYFVRPNLFANGGDRTVANAKEAEACLVTLCKPLFGIGGAKIQSSSGLVDETKFIF